MANIRRHSELWSLEIGDRSSRFEVWSSKFEVWLKSLTECHVFQFGMKYDNKRGVRCEHLFMNLSELIARYLGELRYF